MFKFQLLILPQHQITFYHLEVSGVLTGFVLRELVQILGEHNPRGRVVVGRVGQVEGEVNDLLL